MPQDDKQKKPLKCLFCGDGHFAAHCNIPVKEKKLKIANDNRCNRCLGKHPDISECKRAKLCYKCNGEHHTALCEKVVTSTVAKKTKNVNFESGKDNKAIEGSVVSSPFSEVFLQTATVVINSPIGPVRAVCLLDPGAQRTLIRQKLAEELELTVDGSEFIGFRGRSNKEDDPQMLKRRCFTMNGTFHGAPEIPIMALDKKEILSVQPYGKTDFATKLWFQGFPLADERFISGGNQKEEIDILIGADQYWSIVKPEFKKSGDGLMAISSALGWILTGQTRESASNAAAALTIQMLLHTISAPLSSVLQDEY